MPATQVPPICFVFLFFPRGPVQSKLEKLENWEKIVDIEWKTSVTVATQHGMHVAAQFCASALFCASTLFCATGRRICGHRIRIPARNRSTNLGLTVHIPQNVPRRHSHTPCQVGKNIICGVALVISTVLTCAVNFTIGGRTVTNGKFYKRSTLVIILCRTLTG
jgi:hypothetical protein